MNLLCANYASIKLKKEKTGKVPKKQQKKKANIFCPNYLSKIHNKALPSDSELGRFFLKYGAQGSFCHRGVLRKERLLRAGHHVCYVHTAEEKVH